MWKIYFPIYVCIELHRQINLVGILGLVLKKKTMGSWGGLNLVPLNVRASILSTEPPWFL